ncbi:MAG: hypothetical protein JNM22_00390, partial [Saprospiraceae bacterium]|nr:hypothetical protein [Saprospiraceae bacterium]
PNTCNGCHAADYAATTDPNHATSHFPTTCTTCHSQTAWTPSTFNHNAVYPFTGAHIPIANDCDACHHGNYTTTPNTCAGCHTADYNASTNPNHSALGLSTNCATCHTTDPGWDPATFPVHNNYYVLQGAHATIASDCAACHHGNYNNTPNTCNGCHAADYAATTDPNHATSHFPTTCTTCHSQTAWTPSTFNHNAVYPFTGAHIPIANDCDACHHGNYTTTPNTCAGCHTADYNASTNPNHSALGLSTNCATCHTTDPGWDPATFPVHNNYYVLQGAHATIASDCAACHHGNYNNTPNTCNGCHAADFAATSNPNHAAAQFPTTCTNCHSQTAWSPTTFNHNTIYPFTGAHIPIASDCNACHHGNYTTTPNTCAGCHTADYNASTNPNHSALGLSTNCATCHTTDPDWDPATFPVHNNYYVLQGAHATIANNCAVCHNGNYNNTPNTCNGCHAADYAATSNPNHAAAQFPTTCTTCHSQNAWSPSTFNHNTIWPITGAHTAIASNCNACHNGNYTTTPNTCYGCHAADYTASGNSPNHISAGYPTDCTICHSQNAWSPSTFNHDSQFFPIYSGTHHEAWDQCTDCHTTAGNYSTFSCIQCHEHNNASQMANHHQGVNGYQYSSPACYSCHPNGHS